jgi:Ni/Fe-hydrogenase 1 B-type cytochrome subunit
MATAHAPEYERVYVWELPIRIYHWVNAGCLVLLACSGYLIGNPMTLAPASEAYEQYWFGTLRFAHFAAGFVLLFNFVIRIYWGFVGNRYARWARFIPHRRKDLRELIETLRVDILQTTPGEHVSIGHNALAALTYLVLFLATLVQIFTGIALYSSMSSWGFTKLFSWVVPLLGGDMAVRQWHHAAMWFFILFAMVHVYMIVYHDFVEGRGTASSIVGGWKFERKGVLERRERRSR